MYSIPWLFNHIHIFKIEGKKTFTESFMLSAAIFSFSWCFTTAPSWQYFPKGCVDCLHSVVTICWLFKPLWCGFYPCHLTSTALTKNHFAVCAMLASPAFLKHSHLWLSITCTLMVFLWYLWMFFEISLLDHSPFPVHLMLQFSKPSPKLYCFPLYLCPSQSNVWLCFNPHLCRWSKELYQQSAYNTLLTHADPYSLLHAQKSFGIFKTP